MTPKRSRTEKLIIDTMNLLDTTGDNGRVYKEKFKKMSDAQFDKYMKELRNDDDNNFYLEEESYVREAKMQDIENAANYLGVPLYETIALPFATDDPSQGIITSPMKVAVGYLHIKRPQQTIAKKNSMAINIDKRVAKFGQVIGDSKNSRVADSESIVLISQGLDNTLKEFTHAKADNLKAKNEMLSAISTDGYVSLNDLSNSKTDKVALNTLDVYFTSAMIKTDLITDGLLLNRTLQGNKDVSSISGKYNIK